MRSCARSIAAVVVLADNAFRVLPLKAASNALGLKNTVSGPTPDPERGRGPSRMLRTASLEAVTGNCPEILALKPRVMAYALPRRAT